MSPASHGRRLAACLGVDGRKLRKLMCWRRGGWSSGGAMLPLVAPATRAQEGLVALLNEDR